MKIIREYVRLLLNEAKKIREVEVTDGKRVKVGSRKHVSDLKRRIRELSTWRDRQKKGSDRRADYSRIISRLKAELKQAQKSKLPKE